MSMECEFRSINAVTHACGKRGGGTTRIGVHQCSVDVNGGGGGGEACLLGSAKAEGPL